jgi:hypothetical protein
MFDHSRKIPDHVRKPERGADHWLIRLPFRNPFLRSMSSPLTREIALLLGILHLRLHRFDTPGVKKTKLTKRPRFGGEGFGVGQT